MVKETRIIFGIGDITNVRLCCTNCKGEVMCPLRADYTLPNRCPYCEDNWNGMRNTQGLAVQFISDMRHLLRQQNPPITIRLELDGDAAEEAS